MKKLCKLLVPFLVLGASVLTGCDKDKRAFLSFGDVHAKTFTSITTDNLNDHIENEESFLLVVNSTTCGCWSDFQQVLVPYISENKVICYQISYEEYTKLGADERHGLTSLAKGSTTFAIFKNGKLKKSISTGKQSKIMYNYENFSNFINENAVLPKCFFITKDDVSTIKASGKNAVIYFERSGCGDCNALNPTILASYVKSHKDMNNLYVLDCEEYYRKSNAADYDSYVSFKNEMGMASEYKTVAGNNPIYGYGGGVFPFFSYIENGTYASGAVAYNDVVTKENDKYVIVDSYYTEERVSKVSYTDTVLKGKEIPEKELDKFPSGYVSWKHEYANKHYEKIIASFLDETLPKTTFTF